MCIFDRRKLCFRSFNRSKKSYTTSNFAYKSLHFKQKRHSWSPTFFNPPKLMHIMHNIMHLSSPPRQHLATHAHMHTNKLMLRRIRSTYHNHFQVKKRLGVQDGAPDQACPLPAGGFGGLFRRPCTY